MPPLPPVQNSAMIPRRAALILPLLAGPALAEAPVARRGARPLAGPFRPAPTSTGPAAACEATPRPVWNMESIGFFRDPAFSRPDPKMMRADAEAGRPLLDWLAAVQRAVARHRAGAAGAAACALGMLDYWAKSEALLGGFNLQATYHRKWALAGAALSFLAIREAPGLDPLSLGRTGRWLAQVAGAVRPRYERPSAALISDIRNNEAAWAGLAVAAAGIAARERGLLDWGVVRLRAQLAQVDPRGALPQEVARGAAALHFHLFALQAIAATERLAAANDIALTESEMAAYRRLRDLCLAAAKEPGVMAAIAGVAQEDPWLGAESPFRLGAGLEIATAVMPDPEAEAALAPFRPYAEAWLGGEVTGWWRGAARPGE